LCGESRLEPAGSAIARVASSRDECRVGGDVFILSVGVNTSKLYRESFGVEPSPRQRFLLCQSLVVEMGSALDIPIVYDNTSHLYIVPEAGKRAIVGDGPCEVIGRPEDASVRWSIVEGVLGDLALRVEGSEDAVLVSTIYGVCDLTQDLLPFLGRDERYENLYLAYGLSTYGTMRSPYLGVQLARMALGRSVDPAVRILGMRGSRGVEGCEETHTPIMPRAD